MQVLAGILGPLGPLELGIILLIIVLIFGVGRLPEVGGAIGKSLREFRRSTKEPEEMEAPRVDASAAPPIATDTAAVAPDVIFCGECGAKNTRSQKFCGECGHALQAAVS